MGGKEACSWQTRGHPDGRRNHTCMCAHMCAWGSMGLALGSGLLPGCFRTLKSLFSPAKHWSISTAAGVPESPALEKCQTVWGQASWATHPVESAKTLQLPRASNAETMAPCLHLVQRLRSFSAKLLIKLWSKCTIFK